MRPSRIFRMRQNDDSASHRRPTWFNVRRNPSFGPQTQNSCFRYPWPHSGIHATGKKGYTVWNVQISKGAFSICCALLSFTDASLSNSWPRHIAFKLYSQSVMPLNFWPCLTRSYFIFRTLVYPKTSRYLKRCTFTADYVAWMVQIFKHKLTNCVPY